MAKPAKQWKIWIGIGIGVLILLLIWLHFGTSGPATHYKTAKVTRGKVESVVLASGTLQPYREVDVGAQVSGQLKSLKVTLGEHVTKGQLLAVIDPVLSINQLQVQRAQLDSLKAQKLSAQAQLYKAKLDYGRQKKLLAEGATSKQAMQNADASLRVEQAAVDQATAQIAQARIEVDSAQAKLGYTRIVAPMNGVVVAIVTKQGQTVVAAQQAPVILKLADLSTMTVHAQIPEADVIRLHTGQTAFFTILGAPDQRHYGKLSAIEPAPSAYAYAQPGTNPQDSNKAVFYNALFNVPNTDGTLRIDMTAQVSFVLQSAKDALTIPMAALGNRGKDGLYTVHVVDAKGRARVRHVRIGVQSSVKAQVLSGLAAGEKVVIGGLPAPASTSTISVSAS
ncbi:MAG TPA: macrolide transporter subunit MacA [Rhodanobacteraceae bacterium]